MQRDILLLHTSCHRILESEVILKDIWFNALIQDINVPDPLFSHHMNTCLPPKATHLGIILIIGTKFFLILSQNMLSTNYSTVPISPPLESCAFYKLSSAGYLYCCFYHLLLNPSLTEEFHFSHHLSFPSVDISLNFEKVCV